MFKWLKKYSSPQYFYQLAGKLAPWFLGLFLFSLVFGLYGALIGAPADYQQGDGYRIMFVHVPAAWMSIFVYLVMAFYALIGLVWRLKLADVVVKVSAPAGIGFTLIALMTGSIWGKPMWGTWWVWDARLTSELILLFLYIGYVALYQAFDNPKTAVKTSHILLLVGVINIPIIHYSVVWWNTLHQGASISLTGSASIHIDMLIPLLIMAAAFKFFYVYIVLYRAQYEMLLREQNTRWVKQIFCRQE